MKAIERDYDLTDPILGLKCQDVIDSIDRDILEFTERGFTPAKRTEFDDKTTAFMGMPSDNYLLGQKQIKTQEKDEARALCEKKIRTVLTAVENVWGVRSAEYALFTEDKSLSLLTDPQLLRFMEDFADSTEEYLADLATEGIDATDVTELRDLRTEFNDALKAQTVAEKARNTGNNGRIKAGNELYKLAVKYCNTGKDIWYGTDESKYNDYVIYDTPSGNPPPATGLAELSGEVRRTDVDEPIAGASLMLMPGALPVTTDPNGLYVMPNIPPADYTLSCTAPGFVSQSRPVTLAADEMRVENFGLTPL
ncbi:MAG: carboxypeptidase regulatory-like domain-containing protein [Bacteroidia bacterium]